MKLIADTCAASEARSTLSPGSQLTICDERLFLEDKSMRMAYGRTFLLSLLLLFIYLFFNLGYLSVVAVVQLTSPRQ